MRLIKDSHGEWTTGEAWEHSLSHEVMHLSHPHEAVQARDARVVWAAWSLQSSITQQLPVWLGVHLPACVHVQLWLRWNRGDWQLQSFEHGQRQPLLAEGHLLPVWAIHDASLRQIDVLLRIEDPGSVQLPVWLHKPEVFMRLQWTYALLSGAMLVLLVSVLVYALGLLRFFEKRAVFLFTGMLLMKLVTLVWTSGLVHLILPSLARSSTIFVSEWAVCVWLILSTFQMRLLVFQDNKYVLLEKSLFCWSLIGGLLIVLSCGIWPGHHHNRSAGILSAHMLFMLLCCCWHLQQKISLKSICHTAVWLLYALALVVYLRADKLHLHPADALLLSGLICVSAILLTGWASAW